MTAELSLENIAEASQFIDPLFLRSPQFVSAELSDRLGRETVIKVETFNPIWRALEVVRDTLGLLQFSSSSLGSLPEEARRRAGCG